MGKTTKLSQPKLFSSLICARIRRQFHHGNNEISPNTSFSLRIYAEEQAHRSFHPFIALRWWRRIEYRQFALLQLFQFIKHWTYANSWQKSFFSSPHWKLTIAFNSICTRRRNFRFNQPRKRYGLASFAFRRSLLFFLYGFLFVCRITESTSKSI